MVDFLEQPEFHRCLALLPVIDSVARRTKKWGVAYIRCLLLVQRCEMDSQYSRRMSDSSDEHILCLFGDVIAIE